MPKQEKTTAQPGQKLHIQSLMLKTRLSVSLRTLSFLASLLGFALLINCGKAEGPPISVKTGAPIASESAKSLQSCNASLNKIPATQATDELADGTDPNSGDVVASLAPGDSKDGSDSSTSAAAPAPTPSAANATLADAKATSSNKTQPVTTASATPAGENDDLSSSTIKTPRTELFYASQLTWAAAALTFPTGKDVSATKPAQICAATATSATALQNSYRLIPDKNFDAKPAKTSTNAKSPSALQAGDSGIDAGQFGSTAAVPPPYRNPYWRPNMGRVGGPRIPPGPRVKTGYPEIGAALRPRIVLPDAVKDSAGLIVHRMNSLCVPQIKKLFLRSHIPLDLTFVIASQNDPSGLPTLEMTLVTSTDANSKVSAADYPTLQFNLKPTPGDFAPFGNQTTAACLTSKPTGPTTDKDPDTGVRVPTIQLMPVSDDCKKQIVQSNDAFCRDLSKMVGHWLGLSDVRNCVATADISKAQADKNFMLGKEYQGDFWNEAKVTGNQRMQILSTACTDLPAAAAADLDRVNQQAPSKTPAPATPAPAKGQSTDTDAASQATGAAPPAAAPTDGN